MRKEYNTSRLGLLLFMGVLLAAIWGVALYGVYEEGNSSGVVTYHVSVHPGAVSYGTHSTAPVPMVSMPSMSHTAPMVSGGSVRSYARYGHAASPRTASSSGYRLHTLSSASVHSIGSGGGGGGGMTGSRGSSSSKGIRTSGGAFAMPMLSMGSVSMGSGSSSMTAQNSGAAAGAPSRHGHLRLMPSEPGTEYGDVTEDGEGVWMWDSEEWVPVDEGDTKIVDGQLYALIEGEWKLVSNQSDPGVPVGDTPWLWILLLAVAFALIRGRKVKFNS